MKHPQLLEMEMTAKSSKILTFIILTLLFQIIAGSMHLSFNGDAIKNVYFLNNQLLHIGLIPSFFLFLLTKGKVSKMLGLTLVIYNLGSTLMEIAAMCGHKDIVLKANSYYYSEIIFIILAFILSSIGIFMQNGVHYYRSAKFNNIRILFRRKNVPKKQA